MMTTPTGTLTPDADLRKLLFGEDGIPIKICKNGHPIVGENAQLRANGTGVMCRICQAERVRQWGLKNRERRNANARKVYAAKKEVDVLANGEKRPKTLEERLKEKFQVLPSGCWEWRGATTTSNGMSYGQIWANRRAHHAHRVAYEIYRGPIPDGLVLDHLCRNTRCVNPDHLEPVTNEENIRRGFAPNVVSHRTGLCKRGHALTPENIYSKPGQGIQCRTCTREKAKQYYDTNRDRILAQQKQKREEGKAA